MHDSDQPFDLCLAWDWDGDADFVETLDAILGAKGLRLLQVTPSNLEQALAEHREGRLRFAGFLDRASCDRPEFTPLAEQARAAGAALLNPFECASRSWNKAVTHEMLAPLVGTPRTIVLPPWDEQPSVEVDLAALGPSFVIKPVHGGGGHGVVSVATSAEQVETARRQLPADGFLLQSRVVPARLNGLPAWFRVLYSLGRLYPFWWHPETHAYTPVTLAHESHHRLEGLRTTTEAIAQASGMHLFSTEIALTPGGELVVVDDVNDPIDLRPASKVPQAVPDEIVTFVAEDVAEWTAGLRSSPGG